MIIDVDAVLFDNDGVLVDSHEQVVVAWSQLAEEFGLDIELLLVELVGKRAGDTLGRHLPPDEAARAVARLEDLEVQHAAETRPVHGAIELIDSLSGGRWAIVTSASRRLALARWHGAGVTVPSAVVTAEDVSAGKPSPEPFLTGAKALGVAAERCLVFEDSPSGGAAALAAGTAVVAVGCQPWTGEPAARVDDLRSVRADVDPASNRIRVTIEG